MWSEQKTSHRMLWVSLGMTALITLAHYTTDSHDIAYHNVFRRLYYVPVVLAAQGSHGPVVHAMSAAAIALGISQGQRVVDVQAIHPELHVENADPEGDQKLLERVALWARRWCPWTVVVSLPQISTISIVV